MSDIKREQMNPSYKHRFRKFVQKTAKKYGLVNKRTYKEAFGKHTYETERYGQEINSGFFQENIGHAVIG
jgi:hypothetical protein